MTAVDAGSPSARGGAAGGWLLAAAIGTAACQIALSARIETGNTKDYFVTLTEGWLAALLLAWEGRTPHARVAQGWAIALGVVLVAAGVALLGAAHEYRAVLRVAPLLSAFGILLAGPGLTAAWRHRRELLLLALPLLNPLPKELRHALEPTLVSWTAWWALVTNRALGHAMTRVGNLLSTAGGTLNVGFGCSGLLSISRLLVLVGLVVALFPTTIRQRIALVGSALAIGFFSNALRIALLAYEVMLGEDAKFDYWHEGPGATLHTIASSVVAGWVWWLLLRPRARLLDAHLQADAHAEVAAFRVDVREEEHRLQVQRGRDLVTQAKAE